MLPMLRNDILSIQHVHDLIQIRIHYDSDTRWIGHSKVKDDFNQHYTGRELMSNRIVPSFRFTDYLPRHRIYVKS